MALPGGWWLLAAAVVLFGLGLALAIWTSRLFLHEGGGTPAPWDPPRRLVVKGPYRHVRNPMISSVFSMLAAEAILLGTWPVVAWYALVLVGNAIYMPLWEEPRLEKRFGEDYLRYKRDVPRWIPRLDPWSP